MAKLKFDNSYAVGMYAKDSEYVPFCEPCDCSGKVEQWLIQLTITMRKTMRHNFEDCILTYEEKAREQWIFDYPAQVALVGTQIWWATEVNIAFSRLEEGYEHAMKEYQKKQIAQLNVLITLLCGELTDGTRQKIMTICTIDVHSRDVVAKMIQMKVDNSQAFQWQSQLRHRHCIW
ncbi:Dynein beta chain [Gryllus bimaculatus]|nr:Dynein beta chain [Gryllus bimaculatus]